MVFLLQVIKSWRYRQWTLYDDFVLEKFTSQKQTSKVGSKRHHTNTKYHNNYYLHAICLQLLLSGDISVNPGPVKNPCSACQKPVRKNQRAMGFTYPIPDRWRMCTIGYSISRWRTAISCGQYRSSNMIYYAEMHRQTVEKLT